MIESLIGSQAGERTPRSFPSGSGASARRPEANCRQEVLSIFGCSRLLRSKAAPSSTEALPPAAFLLGSRICPVSAGPGRCKGTDSNPAGRTECGTDTVRDGHGAGHRVRDGHSAGRTRCGTEHSAGRTVRDGHGAGRTECGTRGEARPREPARRGAGPVPPGSVGSPRAAAPGPAGGAQGGAARVSRELSLASRCAAGLGPRREIRAAAAGAKGLL